MLKIGLSLKWVLFLSLTLTAALPTLLLGYWIQQATTANELRSVNEKHLLLARNISRQFDNFANESREMFLLAINGYQEAGEISLDSVLMSRHIRSIGYKEGDNPWSLIWGESDLMANLSAQEVNDQWVGKNYLNKVVFSGVHEGRNGDSVVYLLRKLDNNRWFAATLTLNYVKQVQQSIAFGENGHASVVDQYGKLMAHNNSDWQDQRKSIVELDPIRSITHGQSGVTEFFSPHKNSVLVAAYVIVPSTGWGVLVAQARDEVIQGASDALVLTRNTALGAIGIALVLACLLTYFILSPVNRLVNAASQLSQGVLVDSNKKVFPIIEIRRLYLTFFKMARQMKESQRMLEERVLERTKELQLEVDERKRVEEQFRFLASHDSLTGLPNRQLLEDRLTMALAAAERRHTHLAVMFFDLNGFKPVNDQYGHMTGDKVLIAIADRLQQSLRGADTVARYAGDEFVVIVTDLYGHDVIQTLAEKMLQLIKQPITINKSTINMSASVGVLLVDDGERDPTRVLHEADILMYQAKHNRGPEIVFSQLSKLQEINS